MNCEGRAGLCGRNPALASNAHRLATPASAEKEHGGSCSAATHVCYAQDWMQLRDVRVLSALCSGNRHGASGLIEVVGNDSVETAATTAWLSGQEKVKLNDRMISADGLAALTSPRLTFYGTFYRTDLTSADLP
jgi:hypothetical protein